MIARFGIRATQMFIGHNNIATTVLYDRNSFFMKDAQAMSDILCFGKPPKKTHPDYSSYSSEQLQVYANMIADNQNLLDI